MPLLLGLDAGTTSFKAALFDEGGRLVSRSAEEYALATPAPDRVEFDPEEYWRILCRVVGDAVRRSGAAPRAIAALALSSQGETLIAVDDRGEALGPAIVWLDNRSRREAEIIAAELGSGRAFETTGQPEVVATWPATKILWLRRNAPQLFARAARFLLLEDYLVLRLSGRYAGERSLHSSSMLMDVRSGRPWQEMLALLGIDESRLPPLHDSAFPVGRLSEAAAAATGLSPDTLVVTGALDQAAGMVGSGNIRQGLVTESTGTCLAVCVNTGSSLATPPGSRIPQHHGVLPRSYYAVLWSPTAGAALKWFRDTFAAQTPYDELVAEAAAVAPGAEGLTMLPHLAGSAYPDFDSDARGIWGGIGLTHTRAHFVRSILEAVAFMLRQAVEAIEAQGVPVTEIRSIGGGAASPVWAAIKADVTGKRILPVDNPEPACLGAALLAGVGAGVFASLEAACAGLEVAGTAVRPRGGTAAAYRAAYERFLALGTARQGRDHGQAQ